jgi:HAD superfamily hydrolase (TIGR01484 family)
MARSGRSSTYDQAVLAVLPSGATKGTGLQYALRELGISARNVVACGDAENDRSLLTHAGIVRERYNELESMV